MNCEHCGEQFNSRRRRDEHYEFCHHTVKHKPNPPTNLTYKVDYQYIYVVLYNNSRFVAAFSEKSLAQNYVMKPSFFKNHLSIVKYKLNGENS